MSAVTTATATDVRVSVQSRSIVFAANEIPRLLLETVHARGLSVKHIHENLKLFSESFATWMTGRWLKEIILEIYEPASNKLVDAFEMRLSYELDLDREEFFQTQVDKFKVHLARLKPLPAGCLYRVLVVNDDDRPDLPGWVEAKRMDKSHLVRQNLGGVLDSAMIRAGITYYGKRSDA